MKGGRHVIGRWVKTQRWSEKCKWSFYLKYAMKCITFHCNMEGQSFGQTNRHRNRFYYDTAVEIMQKGQITKQLYLKNLIWNQDFCINNRRTNHSNRPIMSCLHSLQHPTKIDIENRSILRHKWSTEHVLYMTMIKWSSTVHLICHVSWSQSPKAHISLRNDVGCLTVELPACEGLKSSRWSS